MTALELTSEQRLLLTAVAHGASHDQLARERGVSRPAITKQLGAARVRLGAETVTHAVHLATRAGLIPDAAPSEPLSARVSPSPAVSVPSAVRVPAGPSGGRVANPVARAGEASR